MRAKRNREGGVSTSPLRYRNGQLRIHQYLAPGRDGHVVGGVEVVARGKRGATGRDGGFRGEFFDQEGWLGR